MKDKLIGLPLIEQPLIEIPLIKLPLIKLLLIGLHRSDIGSTGVISAPLNIVLDMT